MLIFTAVMQPPGPLIRLAFDRGTLLLTGLGRDAGYPPATGISWVWDDRISAWRCEAIHYASTRDALSERLGDRFRDEVPPPKAVEWPHVDLPPLRPAQRDAVAAWRAAGGRGQVIMPTGTGKTEVYRRFRPRRILMAVPGNSIRENAQIPEDVLVYKSAIKLEPVLAALERLRSQEKST